MFYGWFEVVFLLQPTEETPMVTEEDKPEQKEAEKTEEAIEVDKQNGDGGNIEEEVAGQEFETVDEAPCDEHGQYTDFDMRIKMYFSENLQ